MSLRIVLPLALLAACRAPAGPVVAPVAPSASAALAEARRLARAGAAPDDPALAANLERARAAAPDWVAPMRLEDDLQLRARLDVAALEARRSALRAEPSNAALCYLVGRLEGPAGASRFGRARALDDELAWAHHGVAWAAGRAGDVRAAAQAEAVAVELARDPWERAFFLVARTGQLRALGREEEALALLRAELERGELARPDRLWFESEIALIEVRGAAGEERARGRRRALELLRQRDLLDADLLRLFDALRGTLAGIEGLGGELELALAAERSDLRDALRGRLLLERGAPRLARAMLDEVYGGEAQALGRTERIAAGEPAAALEDWRRSLPGFVLGADGLPRDPRLRRVVQAARALDEPPSGPPLLRLGDALIQAGWFLEARALAELCASHALDEALALRARALAGLDLVEGVRRALSDRREEERLSGLEEDGASADGLEGLLDHLGVLLADADAWLGGERDPASASRQLIDSPRLSYGPFATLVHPGPSFSIEDEREGLGEAGEPVPGLAREMARLGRFAIVGEYLGGGGPDGVMLRRLLVEERAGEHLGVPWRGTIAWCEGAELDARATRAGARLTGAALHEGYWIDLAPVRQDLEGWRGLAQEFRGPGARARLEEVLAARGLRLQAPAGHPKARAFERTRIAPALGEADRVRLAILRDRAADPGDGERPVGEMTLEELLAPVARHEEGHLCDRTRFLPIGEHLGRALKLLLDEGFSPANVMRRLEYRAQLVALCVSEDPRLPLVDLLLAAESDQDGPLPHGAAYRELLEDLIGLLDGELADEPETWPAIDGERTLVHQLHHLRPDEVRTLALRLARKRGLTGS